ncbi:MAG: DUF5995 family protein [Bacteroidales bacterium]|nr:DUF5995 family protein [Bacteroidales bacterium]MCF8403107.1 DUF5995 family protein [Bacteroidales bacterium]
MSQLPIQTIDDVILALESILRESEQNNDPLGFFTALYLKVTTKVKEGIAEGFFDDGPRMEKLDVVFARRYIDAYYHHKNKELVTDSWLQAFEISTHYWLIVLQHLLVGMNAHINLDLGIAATEVSKGKKMEALESDFNKINEILASLVEEVQDNLASIWPILKKILSISGKVDDFMVGFSMKLARNGAWKFACQLALTPEDQKESLIAERDHKVAKKAGIVIQPGFIISLLMKVVRLGERGSVAEKIRKL